MILSNDVTPEPPKGKGKSKQTAPPTTPGERSKATLFFNALPPATQATFLRSTVLISSPQGGRGSGVILYSIAPDAYILTAKHILYLFAGDKKPKKDKTPKDYESDGVLKGATIGYNPPALLAAPAATTAAGLEVDWTYTDEQWSNDLMVLKCADGIFEPWVNANRFLNASKVGDYNAKLKSTTPEVLQKKDFSYIQLGYGISSDKEIAITQAYTNYGGQVQCLFSMLKNRSVIPAGFSIDRKAPAADWLQLDNFCELDANDTKSTAEGDSGGPLFAFNPKDGEFILVGVTSGANYFTDPNYKANPAKAPGDDHMHNNVASYWYAVFTQLQHNIPA